MRDVVTNWRALRWFLQFGAGSIGRLGGVSIVVPAVSRFIQAGMLPQFSGSNNWVELYCLPPLGFIAVSVKGSMMGAAKGDHELIADPAAQCARLHESQVVGVGRPASA
jgi:hypothetical protein